jgi:hypothetical protein
MRDDDDDIDPNVKLFMDSQAAQQKLTDQSMQSTVERIESSLTHQVNKNLRNALSKHEYNEILNSLEALSKEQAENILMKGIYRAKI